MLKKQQCKPKANTKRKGKAPTKLVGWGVQPTPLPWIQRPHRWTRPTPNARKPAGYRRRYLRLLHFLVEDVANEFGHSPADFEASSEGAQKTHEHK
eukprot:5598473-Amphidinium_carterae.1